MNVELEKSIVTSYDVDVLYLHAPVQFPSCLLVWMCILDKYSIGSCPIHSPSNSNTMRFALPICP